MISAAHISHTDPLALFSERELILKVVELLQQEKASNDALLRRVERMEKRLVDIAGKIDDEVIGTKEIAALTGHGEKKVRELMKKGTIKPVSLTKMRARRTDVEAYIDTLGRSPVDGHKFLKLVR